jgi:hypothetical protein
MFSRIIVIYRVTLFDLYSKTSGCRLVQIYGQAKNWNLDFGSWTN